MRRCQPPKTQSPSPKALVIQHQIACPRRLCRCRRGPVQSPGACPPRMTLHSIARCDEQRMNGFAGVGWGTPVALRAPAASDRSVSKSGHRPRQGNLDWQLSLRHRGPLARNDEGAFKCQTARDRMPFRLSVAGVDRVCVGSSLPTGLPASAVLLSNRRIRDGFVLDCVLGLPSRRLHRLA